ncbi:MAG: hypothetical protein ACRDSN_24520, partial [Pseudonocardiaceae bacterium]
LTAVSQQRIIVPTAARDDYLYALRGMTHNANTTSYVAVMRSLQQTSYEVDFSDRRTAELDLRRRGAFDETGPQPGMLAGVLET